MIEIQFIFLKHPENQRLFPQKMLGFSLFQTQNPKLTEQVPWKKPVGSKKRENRGRPKMAQEDFGLVRFGLVVIYKVGPYQL